jgi:hypothetical protein
MRRITVVLFALLALLVQVGGTAFAADHAASPGRSVVPLANCSTPLTLHDGTSQTGAKVTVSARGIWVNLSTLSFDNKTSSYTVGACSVQLASAANGGGALYTSCLSAGCVENTLDPGWDNTFSSVFLN